ncbi:hypothetical protein D3C85_1856450 [compost metagenome]
MLPQRLNEILGNVENRLPLIDIFHLEGELFQAAYVIRMNMGNQHGVDVCPRLAELI